MKSHFKVGDILMCTSTNTIAYNKLVRVVDDYFFFKCWEKNDLNSREYDYENKIILIGFAWKCIEEIPCINIYHGDDTRFRLATKKEILELMAEEL